ncbi:hypothetical protein WN982_11710 [Paraburkholderia sp. IMGN_8]|uniref:hypothetical protein n=1 Tax=Paraburkholderia sp. IMGN_8 TaxID=3136564 RepID=UPI003101044E
MSEYPCTGIDKAVLKFELQDSKKSQNVSVKISIFFRNFFGNCYRFWRSKNGLSALQEAMLAVLSCLPTKLTHRLSALFCGIRSRKKIGHDFFRVFFLFLKIKRTFLRHGTANFIRRFI